MTVRNGSYVVSTVASGAKRAFLIVRRVVVWEERDAGVQKTSLGIPTRRRRVRQLLRGETGLVMARGELPS